MARGTNQFQQRDYTIYYDTDKITETRHETVRVCIDCGGTIKIDSSSNRGGRILAVYIPVKACNRCAETGYNWYHSADTGHFDQVFLQDRTEDIFLE